MLNIIYMEGEVFWIRHGQSVANTFYYLHSFIIDPDLTSLGRKQMLEVAKLLASENIDYIICSPLKRSIESGQIIKSYMKIIGKCEPVIVITSSIKESGLGLDNISLQPTDSIITKIINISPFCFYGIFYDLLRSLLKNNKKIAIIGHQHVNSKFIYELSNTNIIPMKNGEIIKMSFINNGLSVFLQNYLTK